MLGLVLFATPAWAQAPSIESACMNVAKNFLLTDKVNIGIIQSFPELKPPGVRMTYASRPDTPKSDMSDTFECEFNQAQPPYDLTRFCVSNTCYAPDSKDGENKRRFDEMHVLLNRSQK